MKILENDEGKLSDSDEHKLLELYKELGSDFRHFDRHAYIVNFQMLPALVIGLLMLYGRVKKFGVVEFESDRVYVIVWLGCLLISVMWIIGVSRFAQVFHIHAKTRQDCECLLGLNGHRKIAQMDNQAKFLKLPHYKFRLFGFWLYFCLLLFRCPIVDFTDLGVLNYSLFALSIIIISSVVTVLIWLCHFYKTLDIDYGSPLSRKSDKLGQ